jgi:hypothetical protein
MPKSIHGVGGRRRRRRRKRRRKRREGSGNELKINRCKEDIDYYTSKLRKC